MATHEGDWELVVDASKIRFGSSYPIAAFGIHTWFAHTAGDGFLERLRELVLSQNCMIGEIGLDRMEKRLLLSSFEKQVKNLFFPCDKCHLGAAAKCFR